MRDYETPTEVRLGLERYFVYYNHLRRQRCLDRQTTASVYGLEASAMDRKMLAIPARTDMFETGGWRSVAAIAVVAPATLAPSPSASEHKTLAFATAAETLSMQTVSPYSWQETVQRMGTSLDIF